MPQNQSKNRPVIFLAFANDQEKESRYLRNLPIELKAISANLKEMESNGFCEVIEKSNVTIEEIYDVFQEYKNRIAIFHFGGHASSFELLLEEDNRRKSVAYADGLIPFLAQQSSLELVFLNGCNTDQFTQRLIDFGVPSVIGTSQEINDEVASKLAKRFYKGIGLGYGLIESWQTAIQEIKTWKGSDPRDVSLRNNNASSSHFPWNFKIRKGAEYVEKWSLPKAANNPLFGLPEINGYDLPDIPYRFLERYKKEDALIFFGRGNAIRELYQNIIGNNSSPVILFTGQSGVGKSSLLDAGLFPRLESTHNILYIRRDKEFGLLGSLENAIKKYETPLKDEIFILAKVWLRIEKNTQKPLIIILDQIEEVFTRNNENLDNELDHFFQNIKQVFNDYQNRPIGKLILSYRKDYHVEIEDAVSSYRIPKSIIQLKRFSKQEIQSIVNGLTSTEKLRNKYQLTVDEELPRNIADNLWKDQDTPIAPVLQIILTKLWQQQEVENKETGSIQKKFSLVNYGELLETGILLDDFFYQQLSKINLWKAEVGEKIYQSGLALDILHFHITKLNSAESRNLENLRKEYDHRAEVLDILIDKFKELYLLTDIIGNKKTALAHDTLAPIVQKAYRDSDKLGQRAKRILESKATDFKINKDIYLDTEDLALVEQGKNGMRLWTAEEQTIIEKSRKRRKRINLLKMGSGLLGIVFLVGAFFFIQNLFEINFQKRLNHFYNEALSLKNNNSPKEALNTIQQALAIAPRDRNALQIQHNIYTENEFYHREESLGLPIKAISYFSDNKTIAIASRDKVIIIKADGKQKTISTLEYQAEILSLSISPDDQHILIGCQDDKARLIRVNDGRIVTIFKGHKKRVNDAIFSKNGEKILTASSDSTVMLWSKDGQPEQEFIGHLDEVNTVDFSPTGDTILSGDSSGKIIMWSAEGKTILTLVGHTDRILDVNFSKNGNQILSASRDNTARLWSSQSMECGELESIFLGHNKRVNKAIFSDNQDLILTASDDNTIRLWDEKGFNQKIYRGHQQFVCDIDFQGNNNIISTSEDGTIKYWKTDSKVLEEFQACKRGVSDMVVSSDNRFLYISESGGVAESGDLFSSSSFNFNMLKSKKSSIYCWDLENEKLEKKFEYHSAGINDLDLSESGDFLVSASDDKTIIIQNLITNDSIQLDGHQAEVYAVSVAPNSDFIISGSADSTAIIWDIEGNLLHNLPHPNVVSATDVSPNNKIIITASYDGYLRLWNRSGNKIDSIAAHNERILDCKFSPDGKYILTGSLANQAKLWSLDGKLLQTFILNVTNDTGGEGINKVTFSPDGKLILLASEGHIAKVFNLEGQEIQTLDDFDGKSLHSVVYDKTGATFMVGSGDGKIRSFKNLINQ